MNQKKTLTPAKGVRKQNNKNNKKKKKIYNTTQTQMLIEASLDKWDPPN